jgi:diguanylate cyclase
MSVNTDVASQGRSIAGLARSNSRLVRKVRRLEREAAQARHVACHDPLTGLPNRSLLLDRLRQAMLQAERQRKSVGVLLLDLDRFKSVNDARGHAAGDQILQQVAARLSFCIRGCDTACRYGGDEFVIMLPEIGGLAEAEAVAQKIRARLSAPYVLDDARQVAIGASIGVALFSAGGADCGALIGEADTAMYRAKVHRASPGPLPVPDASPPVDPAPPLDTWEDEGGAAALPPAAERSGADPECDHQKRISLSPESQAAQAHLSRRARRSISSKIASTTQAGDATAASARRSPSRRSSSRGPPASRGDDRIPP